MEKDPKKVFFVHIPKTAGTSFRNAAESNLGRSACVLDYGPKQAATDPWLVDLLYKDCDFYKVNKTIKSRGSNFICGHVNTSKYIRNFGSRNTVTIFRDPVQRIISEYLHFVRVYNYKDDLQTFIMMPHNVNKQSKKLSGVPIEAIGLLGVTEKYSDFLSLFNNLFGHDFSHKADNLASEKPLIRHEVAESDLKLIQSLNGSDLRLYSRVNTLFRERLSRYKNNQDYAHGCVQAINPNRLAGWCWWFGSDQPVELLACVNDIEISAFKANEFRPGLLQFGVPRDGYVGFSFQHKFSIGDKIKIFTADTGQVIYDEIVDEL